VGGESGIPPVLKFGGNMNHKGHGENGERIAIGELAKHNIDVAIPLSENLPFDFIVIHENKLYKVQVKSSKPKDNFIEFDLRSINWHNKEIKKYTLEEVDVMILCDYENIYLVTMEEIINRRSFTIRYGQGTQPQQHLFKDYVISQERIQKVFKTR
jgi:hypothetical protein